MASNSIICELAAGDRVQVYMYTFTGLHDKPGNRLTQFMGCLLRPLERLSSNFQVNIVYCCYILFLCDIKYNISKHNNLTP